MTPADLTTLRDRIASATGPDRELDAAIHEWQFGLGSAVPEFWPAFDPAPYTTSIDAAVALIERAGLTMAGYSVRHVYAGMGDWLYSAGVGAHGNEHVADGPTAPLALLLALINALLAQEAAR